MKNTKQYEKVLSPKEIREIESEELRNLRLKYWNLRHDAFMDDSIPEDKLDSVINKLFDEEQMAMTEYRKAKGDL